MPRYAPAGHSVDEDEEETSAEEAVQTLPPDFKFGDYRIGRTLGVGAFGAVYEAFRTPLNKRVALKVLHPEMATNQDAVARFIREAELVAQIEHPNIVAVLDVGVESGVPFLAMEFLEGETLAARLARGPMTLTAALDVMLPVISAVAVVHERGVIHRDLKPDNIYLARKITGAVVPVLLDFGIAKVQEARHSMTRTHSLMGTPFYMSPEQAREARNVDARSDQWTLAVILWECIAGKRLFEGGSLLEILMAIATQPIAALNDVVPDAPAGFEAAFMRALSREAADRYASTREFGVALLPFASAATRVVWADALQRVSEIPAAPLMLSAPPTTPSVNRAMAALLGSQNTVVATQPKSSSSPPESIEAPSAPQRAAPDAITTPPPPAPRLAPSKQGPRIAYVLVGLVVLVGAMVAGGAVVQTVLHPDAPVPVSLPGTAVEATATYTLAVRVQPSTAVLELDGNAAGTGLLLRSFTADGRPHTLRIAAPGYESRTLTFHEAIPEQHISLAPARPDAGASADAEGAASPGSPAGAPDEPAPTGHHGHGHGHGHAEPHAHHHHGH